jgi:hypothetical protein
MAAGHVTQICTPSTSPAEGLRQRALLLLNEMGQESGKAFAIAAAGRSFVGESAILENHLFETIEDILGDAVLRNELEKAINELAALAAREARHG